MHSLPAGRIAALALCFAGAATQAQSSAMFTEASFSQIKFLEGRWKGAGPDGKEFFEEYLLEKPGFFRSMRHADSTFSKVTDGSTVALKDGVVVSTWGQFTWKATSISGSKACFEPINAPSSFCWQQIDANTVTVTQRWTGADGKEQSFAIKLIKLSG